MERRVQHLAQAQAARRRNFTFTPAPLAEQAMIVTTVAAPKPEAKQPNPPQPKR